MPKGFVGVNVSRIVVSLLIACFVISCKEVPYSEPSEEVVIDSRPSELALPKIDIPSAAKDNQAPKILGMADGVQQKPYVQETKDYRQRFVDDKKQPHYEIEPVGDAVVLDFNRIPTIYRWYTHIDDEKTAPSYLFNVVDDDDVAKVRFAISYECRQLDSADREAVKNESGTYEIKIIQSKSDFDLTRDSEENARGKTHCLSIWASDQSGNASNLKIEFIWKLVMPALAIEVNAGRYKAHHRENDISWVGPPVWNLFRGREPITLKKDLVVAHAIIANPFSLPLSVNVQLKKSLALKLNGRQYQIPEGTLDIKYFAYDLSNNEVGEEKTKSIDAFVVNGHEAVVAEFVLAEAFPISDVRNPDDKFWQTFSLELGFAKLGKSNPMVDGLNIVIRDPGISNLSREFPAAWGDDHHIRRRAAPRQG